MKLLITALLLLTVLPAQAALDWDTALNGAQRSAANKDRDTFRHPRETLEFFGLTEAMTVVELSPGGGWYTEILAPLLAERGQLYAAHFGVNGGAYTRRSLGGFLTKLGSDNDLYGKVAITTLQPPAVFDIAPAASADLILAFRNIHSWMGSDSLAPVFSAVYAALKPGGIFGVVQHRAKSGASVEQMKELAYVTEAHVIAAAQAAGLQLAGRSEVNANPLDTADYVNGVWTLPPALAEGEKDRAKYMAIGESDRMTLKFRKPAE